METYKLKYCTVRVNDLGEIRICEVFNSNGTKINEIQTTTKGKYAAKLAEFSTIQWRLTH